jgi:hypothetical protein
MAKLKFLICFILFANSVFSQKLLVDGFVKDGNQFLSDVKIYSSNQVNKIITRKQLGKKQINSIKTDKNGYFKFEKLKKNDSLTFSQCDYKNLKISVKDFIKEKTIQLEKEDCSTKIADSNYNLIAFIGKKISIKRLPTKNCCWVFGFDSEYLATYKIEKMLHGFFSTDTISFKVYDHYGQPEFSKYENVILYVLKKESENIHLKYQFDIIYKDINNNWYSPYSYLNNKKEVYKSEFQPEIVLYKEKIKFNLSDNNPEWNTNNFPKPYFKIKRNYAIPVFGYKVNDLIKMKLNYFKKVYKLKI